MTSASDQDVLSLILQSTLAVDALSFGLLTLVAALLNETMTSVKGNEAKHSALRADYEAELQALDLLDVRRRRAIEELRDLQVSVTRGRARSRLLAAALLAVAVMVVIATVVTVYSFALLNRTGVNPVLQVAFYALMVAPLLGAVIMMEIVRRIRQSEQ
jgi:hypothetical protein